MTLHALVSVCLLAATTLAGAAAAEDTPATHLARMQQEHQHDAPVASPATLPEPAQKVTAEAVVYAHLGEREVRGYLARPEKAGGALPGVLVIQEWWGLNDHIRAMTRRLAGEGYVALAVDLYEGKVATTPDEATAAMKATLDQTDRLLDNLRQARQYLSTSGKATKIGVVGWCFGGGWSLQTALDQGDAIAAAVMYYGHPTGDPAQLGKLKAPLLGLFGGADTGIPVADVRQMEAELKKLGKDVTIVVYEGAGHAFANPSGTRYDAKAADDAWKRTTAFFAAHLK